MKHPLTLALVATALGLTASILVAAQAVPTPVPFTLGKIAQGQLAQGQLAAGQPAAETAVLVVKSEAKDAGWLRLISDDGEEGDHAYGDDEADNHCEDDDEYQACDTVPAALPTGPVAPPNNGLFSTGKAPQVRSN